MTSTDTATYATAYAALTQSAERLRALPPEDIDSLVALVEDAAVAHRACKDRLAAVRQLIEGQIDGAS